MDTFLNILVNGLIIGAVYAIAASGLVVTYSTSGIFNFAHGGLGMFCAFVYWDLRVNDNHKWPLLPEGNWPAPLALGFVLLILAPLIGLVMYRVIIRGLQGTSEIVKLVIPISVMLACIGFGGWIWDQSKPHALRPFFGADNKVTFLDVVLTYHDITIVIISILLAIGLRILLYRTRTGVAMRAVVDDRPLLELNGGRPDRASAISWMLGVSLSALAGILITPFNGGSLSTTLLTFLVINAFAAAMVGRLRSLPLTYLGAVILGIVSRLGFAPPVGIFPRRFDWSGNFRSASPMILLFIVLLVLPQDRLRGAVITRTRERFSLPSMEQSAISAGVLVFVVFLLSRIMAPRDMLTLSNGFTSGIIMLSLVLLVGYAGEVSFATMAFAAIGGTVFYHHVGHDASDRAGIWPYIVAMAVTALVGAVVALPALRLRGLYLGLATAAFSVGVEQMLFKELSKQRRIYPIVIIALVVIGLSAVFYAYRNYRIKGAAIAAGIGGAAVAIAATNNWLVNEKWSTIFPNGNLQVPRPKLFGIDFKSQQNYMLLLIVVFALVGLMLIALRRSAYGRRLSAMKDSPAACATLGMNIVRLKLSVFMLSAAIAALGGCLFAQQVGAVTADRFSLFESLAMFMLVVVAGVGYVSGGFAGGLMHGAVFFVIQSIFTKLQQDYSAAGGLFNWWGDLSSKIGPALIGIGLGKNPSGFVNDIFLGFKPMVRKVPIVFAIGCAIEFGAWALAWQDVIGNWTFALFTIAMVLFWPRVAMLVNPGAFLGDDVVAAQRAATPLELVGLERPFTAADLALIDAGLALDSLKGRA